MSDTKELVFNQGHFMLGIRKVEPCDCGRDDCPQKDAASEITIIVSPTNAEALCKGYIENGGGNPMAFPVFTNAKMARQIAAKLNALADEADPPIDTKIDQKN